MKRMLIASLLFYALVIGGAAYAQAQQDPFAQYGSATTERCGPQFNGDYILCESTGGLIQQRQTNFAAFLREMYTLAFILAGTVAFVRIVYGGVLYSWSGVTDQKKKAIGIFWNVATGMALLMGSYAVLNTINPALTILALPNVTMRRPQNSSVPTLPLSSLNEMPSPIDLLDKSINGIRKENEALINGLGLYTLGMDAEATRDLVNSEIERIGTPSNNAERARLGELQKSLQELEEIEAQANAVRSTPTNTPPQQYKRTKTTQ